jgi:hypothetical protein
MMKNLKGRIAKLEEIMSPPAQLKVVWVSSNVEPTDPPPPGTIHVRWMTAAEAAVVARREGRPVPGGDSA